MSSKTGNTLGLAIGAAFIGSLSLSQLAAASPAFQVSDLAAGYMLAHTGGHVDLATLDANGDGKVSLAEAKAAGFSEESFNKFDKNGDGVLDAAELKTAQASMDKNHPPQDAKDKSKKDAKAAEGSCGGHKDGEGSCGGMRG